MTDFEHQCLWALVNEHGVFAVLDAMSGICGNNAEDAAEDEQPKSEERAADWIAAESAIDAAASKVLELFK